MSECQVGVLWILNTGSEASDNNSYERSFFNQVDQNVIIYGSSNPEYRGKTLRTPEELLVAALSSCHLLW